MHRAMTVVAVVVLAIAACSSATDDVGGSAAGAEPDPVTTFCADWVRFDALTNSDDDPTEQLVREVLDLQEEMEAVLPDGLEAEWASILDWNTTFLEYFETAGYGQLSDEAIFDLLGGEDAAEAAGQDREDAYQAIQRWARDNCPADGDTTFCALWPVYDEFFESDTEPNEELVAELLEQQDAIDDVLPPELRTAWAGIVDWNQAFIDVFEQVGYGPVTEETFDLAFGGDEEAAEAAEEAIETGLATIRSWTESNCSDESEHAVTFCEAWDEFTSLTADEDTMTSESYDKVIAVIDRVGDEVPVEIHNDWNAVVESARGFHDVLVSVSFEPSRINDDLLEQAFGSIEAAVATEEAADAALAAIEEWALTGCGDFCSRWPELRQALDDTSHEMWWVRDEGDGEGRGRERLDEHLRTFDLGSQLVPDEIREPWDLAVAARRDWIAWWDSFEYDGERFESPEVSQRALEIMRGATYLVAESEFVDVDHLPIGRDQRRVIFAWQDDADDAPAWLATASELGEDERREIVAWFDGGEPPRWIVEFWYRGPNGWFNGQITAGLDGWVNENCDAVTGRPGTVAARYPRIDGAAGDTLVLALMPRGAEVDDIGDTERALAGDCREIERDPWGFWYEEGREQRWESEPFLAERWEGGLCDYQWEEGPARLGAGEYTMLAAVIEGRPGRTVLGAPSACLAFDVRIDGDTVIDVPTLPPCDVDLGGSDDPWRNPPAVDPSTLGAGTLQVVFPDLVGDEQGGEVIIVVLPAGTTLNDVGREQVWPAAAIRTWLADGGMIEDRRFNQEIHVPMAPVPPTGAARALAPDWLAEHPPADRLPLAVLAPGAYDVHVQVIVRDPPELDRSESAQNDRCGTFGVTIAGDTVVDLPELGECPRVV